MAHQLMNLLHCLATVCNMDALIVSLLQSCAEGNPDLLQSCLQYGLDLNFVTEDGLTPLMYAVTYAGIIIVLFESELIIHSLL